MTLRTYNFLGMLDRYLPTVSDFMMNKIVNKLQNDVFSMRPEWRLSPAPPLKHSPIVISDNLVKNFADGVVNSVPAVEKFLDGTTVQLTDGTKLEVDTVICCTGYRKDFSIMDRNVDPTRNTTPRWLALPGSYGKPLPRLYQNIFSLDHPDSLAFTGCIAFVTGAFPLYDLVSMALAQIWAGNSKLPSIEEMNKTVDEQHDAICDKAKGGPTVPAWVKQGIWEPWAHEMAGTGIAENLGWGWKSWSFWWNNRQFYKLLMSGIYSPFLFRVFDGKRKKWDGAKEAIERLNQK